MSLYPAREEAKQQTCLSLSYPILALSLHWAMLTAPRRSENHQTRTYLRYISRDLALQGLHSPQPYRTTPTPTSLNTKWGPY